MKSAKSTASKLNSAGMSQKGNTKLNKSGCKKIKGGGMTPDSRAVSYKGKAPKKLGL